MESQPEIVAAAEAVRVWVIAQRATWTASQTPSSDASFGPSLPALTFNPQPIAPVVSASPMPITAPSMSLASATVPTLTVPDPDLFVADEPVIPETILPSVTVQRPALFSRGPVRVALGIALVAVLVGGGMLARRLTSASKIGTAVFSSVPPGAQIVIDGETVGSTPLRLELAAGAHAVEFKLKATSRTQNIDVAAGRETTMNVDWNARRLGGLQVNSTPTSAKVSIDGRERGRTPLVLTDLPVGPHVVLIDSSEGSVRRKVEITEGKRETLSESIYSGWLHVSSPIDVTVVDGAHAVQLDDRNRVLLKPGAHTLRIENRTLDFSQTRQVEIEPGGTANVTIEPPTSTLAVTGSTGAEVFVDGVKAGETPLADYQVKLGTHDIMVVDASGATRHATTTVTSRPAQVDISFTRP